MSDTAKGHKQGADGVRNQDLGRQYQGANVNTACPGCGVYPGQPHHPTCKALKSNVNAINNDSSANNENSVNNENIVNGAA